MSVDKSFTAVGVGPDILVRGGESFVYSVSGTFVGTAVVEEFVGGGWTTRATVTGVASGTIIAEPKVVLFARFRARCSAFTSGTIVTSLAPATTDVVQSVKDDLGNDALQVTEVALVVAGGRALVGGDTVIVASAATLALAAAAHDKQNIVLTRAAGVAVTLPAATGSGARFRIGFGLALSSAAHTIAVASGTDYLRGLAIGVSHTDGTPKGWKTTDSGTVATESDTMTFDGATQGGVVGDGVELVDIAAHVWMVRAFLTQSATEVTPFSAAV